MSEFNAIQHYQMEFHRLQSSLPGENLAWLQSLRTRALESFCQLGFPQKNLEEWKYTSTLSLSMQPFYHESKVHDADLSIESVLVDSYRCVFIDGHFHPKLSVLPEGMVIIPLSQALKNPSSPLEKVLKASVAKNSFHVLNTALMQDGMYIQLPRGFRCDKPIEIHHRQLTTELASHYRHVILMGEDSDAMIIEVFSSDEAAVTFTNSITEVMVERDSQLKHIKIIEESSKANHLSYLNLTQAENSATTSMVLTLSGGLVRSDTSVYLEGTQAESELFGLYLGQDQQHIDHHTEVHHIQPHTKSNELYKGILKDYSKAVFNGKVIVYKEAQKSVAGQTNKNLLLSPHAEIDTKPQLEIFADDVKCSHGATVGQLDPDALFYLQSRGLSRDLAESLMMQAFMSDFLDEIKYDSLKSAFMKKIAEHRTLVGAEI